MLPPAELACKCDVYDGYYLDHRFDCAYCPASYRCVAGLRFKCDEARNEYSMGGAGACSACPDGWT